MADNEFLTGYLSGQNENKGNNGMFGGGWEGLLGLIVILGVLNGGWGGGFGGFGGGAGLQGMATRADINAGFQFNDLQNSVRGIERGICDGFYSVQGGFNTLSSQLAQCCCDNRAAVADLKYDLSTQFCGLGNAIQMQTRDIIDNQNANYRGIMDFLVTEKLSAKDAQIAQLQNQVSQANQTAAFRAAIDASTAEIIRRTGNDCPTPAYWVNPPTPVQAPCSWTNGGFNGGCGCGC